MTCIVNFSQGWPKLTERQHADICKFIESHGFMPNDGRWVFQVATSWAGLLVTVWWLHDYELDGRLSAQLQEGNGGDIVSVCRRTHLLRRRLLPSWWRTTALATA